MLREGYSTADLASDALAGCVVGIVALPLAMALAIAVGVPPQHGLYTAIVAGALIAILGGSRTQVSGPTAAFVVILAPLYAKFGMAGLILSGLAAGLMLIGMALGGLGRLIEFIPYPVTTGFTAGIATVIATLQLKDFFGLTLEHTPESYFERVIAMIRARGSASGHEVLIGALTLALLVGLPRITRRVPAPLIALPAAAAVAAVMERWVPGFHVATISSRFGGIPQLPPLPVLPWELRGPEGAAFVVSFETVRALLSGAFAIAMLGAIESLLSAVVADGLAGTKHDPDAELLALGVGNVVAPFFGGIAATGAIARTATNIKAGARSPIASILHALVLLIAILALAPLLGLLPMAGLAALLLVVAWNMSEARHFAHALRIAPKSDVAVLVTCYALTVAVDMVIGVSVGMVLAAFLFMGRMADVTHARFVGEGHPAVSGQTPAGVLLYEISGPLFFGAAQKAMATLDRVQDHSRVVVLMMGDVHAMDLTGLVALENAVSSLEKGGRLAVLSAVRPQPLALLEKARFTRRPGVVVCSSGDEALGIAVAHLTKADKGRGTAPG